MSLSIQYYWLCLHGVRFCMYIAVSRFNGRYVFFRERFPSCFAAIIMLVIVEESCFIFNAYFLTTICVFGLLCVHYIEHLDLQFTIYYTMRSSSPLLLLLGLHCAPILSTHLSSLDRHSSEKQEHKTTLTCFILNSEIAKLHG